MHDAIEQSRATRWATLVCYGSMTGIAISVNLVPVYLTTFSEVFGGPAGLTEEQLGRIPAVVFAATVVGILISGPLADRWGAKRFAMLGNALTVVGLCMLAVSLSYGMLLAAGAVMGLGGGVLDMILSPIVCALHPHRRGRILNWLHSFYCIGALGTVLAASAALRFGVPWRVLALGISIVPVFVLVGFAPLALPPLVHESATRTRVAWLFREPFFLAALLAIGLCGATEQGMSQWLPAYAERTLGYSKAVGGLALAGFSIGMIIGRVTAGYFAHHARPRTIMLAGCTGCVLGYGAACFAPLEAAALAGCVAIGFTVSCLWPTALGVAADRFPHGGASMFGLMTAAGNIGCFAMPWIIGVIAHHLTLRIGLAAVTLCPLLLAGLVLALTAPPPSAD
ncbi:MAG TPA: MFS transporter [Candidatus Hydrogenedentes bacterium]|nr:MFS transporter [Candidatus Hydrogenedentota bacterium]